MKWTINKNSETKVIDSLSRELNISTVLSSMLVKRGVTTFEQAKDFFRPNFEKLHDPFLMKDMIEATSRIKTAIEKKEKIMSKVQDYPSRLGDNSSRKFETFSYLPAMTDKQIREQVQYIVDQGYNPGVEHTEVENAMENYWYMWKLPMFGETDVDTILAECKACHDANPENHVRLIGYDNYAQSQGASMVIYRGKGFK